MSYVTVQVGVEHENGSVLTFFHPWIRIKALEQELFYKLTNPIYAIDWFNSRASLGKLTLDSRSMFTYDTRFELTAIYLMTSDGIWIKLNKETNLWEPLEMSIMVAKLE